MTPRRSLAPLFIGTGTITGVRDMVRAMETIEAFTYTYTVDGERIAEGSATLVKILADPESSTLLVNECLFVNIASFDYLTFETAENGRTHFELHADGATLEIVPVEDASAREDRSIIRLIDEVGYEGSFVVMDDEDEDD
ncbi:MAG: hypothetical protein QMC79_00065 [Anaerosomatales bacterium]|nr:hypothetical protein [Anaerosomatales bacterium]